MATRTTGRLVAMMAGLMAGTLALSGGALAQDVTKLGTFNQWSAWKSSDSTGPICYISSDPEEMLPTNVDHGEVHFFVIHRQGLGTRREVQALMGYNLKTGSVPTAALDGKSYDMVIEGPAAWLASPGDEPGFVDGMKAGRELVVKATSQRGTNTSYSYSLSGVTAAMGAIDKACS